MVPFNLKLHFAEGELAGTAEQLDQITDTDGFMRYQVTALMRRGVVFVNTEMESGCPVSEQDMRSYGEPSDHPGRVDSYSEDEVFSAEELRLISAAITTYNNGRMLNFDQMNFDF